MDRIAAKCYELETADLLVVAVNAAARMDDEGDMVLNAALMVLEGRMDEKRFVEFCDQFAA